MDEIRKRLESELNSTVDRLRAMGGAIVLDDDLASLGNSFADEMDMIRLNEDREMSLATRSLLVERANRLAEALDRLRGGEYGLCEECGDPIAPARLRAMPEVATCVRCQDRLERMARQLEPVGVMLDPEDPEED